METANTLAFYNTETMTDAKGFIVYALVTNQITTVESFMRPALGLKKLFSFVIYERP
jgi:hypothetical protein